MRNLRINWKYSLINPGFYLILGLLLTCLSFIFFQVNTLPKIFLGLILSSYLICLMFFKFPKLKTIFIPVCFIFIIITLFKKIDTNKPDFSQPILIYPDQVKVSNGFVSGQGTINSKPVNFSLKENIQLKDKLINKQSFYLSASNKEIEKITGATNPGEYDFQKYYFAKDIDYKIKIASYKIYSKKQSFIDYLHTIRTSLQNYFKSMPKITGFMASEMILAQNLNSENQDIINSYCDLGVIHLLSVSGLHVRLYVLILGYVCTYLKRTEEETIMICLILLCLEVFFTSFQAGFVRATISYVLASIFRIKNIKISSGDTLGLVAIIHLLIQPKLFLNCGALLSYLLVLGLEFTKSSKKIIQGMKLNLLITPILLMQFYQINVLTFIYNLLIVPIFNFILLPLTFIAVLFYSWLPNAVLIIEKVFGLIMLPIDVLAKSKIGILTFGQIKWWHATFLILLTCIYLIDPKLKLKKASPKVFLLFCYILLFINIHFPIYGQVTFIDVGQGDSILITTPIKRKSFLIDTGGKLNFGKNKSSPQVNRITIPFLKSQGIDKLDGIFLSHQDADHIGDLGALLEQMKVEKLYFANGLNKNKSFQKKIIGKVDHTKLVPLLADDKINENDIVFNVVYPFKKGLGKNEDSLSLAFKLAGKSWLFTGDLDRNGEKEIIEKYLLKIDYLKLGHHGSKTASDPTFIKKINPEVAFISSGRNNHFGHPHAETIATLERNHIPYLNTQENGTITWNYSIFNRTKLKTFLHRGK